MTEYDYSPEAYARAAATDKRIRNWRDMCDHHAPQFSTPFNHTASEHHARRAVSPSSSESSLVDSTYDPHRSSRRHHHSGKKKPSKSSSSKHKDGHKSRSRSMSYSAPPTQHHDYYHQAAAQPIYVAPHGHDGHHSRSSSRHHGKKDRDRYRDRERDAKRTTHQPTVTTPGVPAQSPYGAIPLGNNMYYTTTPPLASPTTYNAAPGYFNMYPQQQAAYYPTAHQAHAARSNSLPLQYIPGQPGHYPTPGGGVAIVPSGARPMSPHAAGYPTSPTKTQPWFKRFLGMGGGGGGASGSNSSRKHSESSSKTHPNKIRSRRRSY